MKVRQVQALLEMRVLFKGGSYFRKYGIILPSDVRKYLSLQFLADICSIGIHF